MVTLLKSCRIFLLPYLSPLSVSRVPLRFHSLVPKIRSYHAINKGVHCMCSVGNSQSSFIGENNNSNCCDGNDGRSKATTKRDLWLYNTMSRQKELFKPKVAGKVGMYVCGITAYDFSHIGHARAYVTFDCLYRYLKYLGYEVCYVRNFTDVDDKIIARANELGENPISLSRRFCDEFLLDMASLHCLPPSVEPRVSNHIPQIIDMIKQIIDNGYAYCLDGDVYFAVERFADYGRLSGRKLEDNRAGERVAVDSRKRNPADFALWKAAKEGEPFWESPWGPGRPGWHIECSAMSAAYLGYSFDIHGGGMDLMFPHHENEIVQSCAACRESNVSYWVHNGFVTVDSEKMSKSLGNFFTIRQVLELYHPLALRLFLMGTHYRAPINYSDALLESASERIFYICQKKSHLTFWISLASILQLLCFLYASHYIGCQARYLWTAFSDCSCDKCGFMQSIMQTLKDCEDVLKRQDQPTLKDSVPQDIANCVDKFYRDFVVAMSDDLHTPVVLAALSDPLKIINDFLHTRKAKKRELRGESLAALERTIRNVLSVLGLMPSSYSLALHQLREKALNRAKLSEAEVLQKIVERDAARKNKEYERSDSIRKELAAMGIALMDSPEGTTWRPVVPSALQQEPVTAS